MKRLVLLLAVLGCDETEPVMPDASIETDATRVCERLSAEQSYASPVGDCCDERAAILCGQGTGVCVVDLCVRQCNAHVPKCPLGDTETWVMRADGNQCLCVEN